MPSRVGTTENIIDWDKVIETIVPKSGDFNTPQAVIDRSSGELDDKTDPTSRRLASYYQGIMDTWREANYDFKNIQWYDYYPGEHFDIEVQNKFADLVNADPLRVFVSEVWPGHCVPYHWDVEDNEEEWLAKGELVRYVAFMQKEPGFGHVFILEDQCFYNVPQHEIYKWDSYRSFHAGTNCGEFPYYLFHFLGRPR